MRIKRECHSPYTAVCIKPEFLHVRVLGPIQGIHTRSLRQWSKLLDYLRLREQLVLDRYRESIELGFKLVCEHDDPRHGQIQGAIHVGQMIAVELVEYAPRLDPTGSSARIAVEILRSALCGAPRDQAQVLAQPL